MSRLTRFLFIIVFLSMDSAFAHVPEEGKITAMFGPFLYRNNFSADLKDYENPHLTGVGLIVNGDLDKNGGLEIGMFYLHKIFLRNQTDDYIAERIKVIHITMGYRHWFSEEFSGSLSFYSAYPMGDGRVQYSDLPSNTIDTSASDATEYGFDFALQWEFWEKGDFAGALEARYSKSITQKDHEDGDHYGAMLGLKYMIQEKKRAQNSGISY